MTEDEELQAMTSVAKTLDGLIDDLTRRRVVDWLIARFAPGNTRTRAGVPGGKGSAGNVEDIADLFERANAKNDQELALVAGYWIQQVEQAQGFAAQTANAHMKDLGHGAANITTAFRRLMKKKPALVMQVKKSGTSKQARKVYRLTTAGIRRVREMIEGSSTANDFSD